MYRAQARRPGSVQSSSLRKKKLSSSLLVIGLQSKKVMRTSFDEGVEVEAESFEKKKDVTDVTTTASGALQPKADSTFEVLQVALRDRRFVKDTFHNERKSCMS